MPAGRTPPAHLWVNVVSTGTPADDVHNLQLTARVAGNEKTLATVEPAGRSDAPGKVSIDVSAFAGKTVTFKLLSYQSVARRLHRRVAESLATRGEPTSRGLRP